MPVLWFFKLAQGLLIKLTVKDEIMKSHTTEADARKLIDDLLRDALCERMQAAGLLDLDENSHG